MSEKFQRPPVAVSQSVLWTHDGQGVPSAAVVTEVGDTTVGLIVFPPGYSTGFVRSAVHHKDDPLRLKGDRGSSGCWVHTPETLAVQKLIDDLQGAQVG